MKPTHGQRSTLYKPKEEKRSCASKQFVEVNTHHNITMKREFVFLEDVKHAININSLEERIILKRWFLAMLHKGISAEYLMGMLDDSAEKDRHRLQKEFRITL
jgi:hypothetical protein